MTSYGDNLIINNLRIEPGDGADPIETNKFTVVNGDVKLFGTDQPNEMVILDFAGGGISALVGDVTTPTVCRYLDFLDDSNIAPKVKFETVQSATAAGEQGQIQVDGNYIYVCVDADTWMRKQLDSF
tara:strand:+ start:235 stop:615 length:381 start_codon:yes stop_codon:yes gene_type:complete